MTKVNLKSIARLVSWLDGYASLSSTDPLKVERLVKEIGSAGHSKKKQSGPTASEVAAVWDDVRKDVYDIANLPGSSDEIMGMSKRVGIARMLVPFLGAAVVLIFLALNLFGVFTFGTYARIEAIVVVIIAYNVTIISYMVYNRRLGSMVSQYYKKHADEVTAQRKHVRASVQKLIDVLASGVRANEADPDKYRFSLSNTDYSNINIIGEAKGGSRHIAAVKGKYSRV
ncbi:MAG: hypothetical protein ACYC7D_15620 [Nitrososphaerales archaeon]